jgi:hypothetical protein
LTVGYGEHPLKAISVFLPHALGVSSGKNRLQRGVLVSARGKRLKFSAKVTGHVLQITLHGTAAGAQVTVGRGLITASAALSRRVKSHKLGTLAMVLAATEFGGARHRLRVHAAVK